MFRNVYFKEMKDSFRDRRTLLLTVALPIIMMTALTFFYESMISSDDERTYTLAVESAISAEEEALVASFENVEYVQFDDPENALMEGEAEAALELSPDFYTNIANGEPASATLTGDSFSQNSSTLMALVTNELAVFEREVVTERLQAEGTDPGLVQPFTIEQTEIAGENTNVNLLAMLIPLILSLAIGIGAGPAASDLFAGEKERKTMEALLMTPVNRSTLLVAKWLTITTIGSLTGIVTLIVVAVQINFFTVQLREAVMFNGDAFLIIGIAVLVSIIYAMFVASLLMLTSILGKTVKESQSYSSPVLIAAVFPVMIVSMTGVNELSFVHFAVPVLNLFSLMKELLFGIVDYGNVLLTVSSNLLFIIIMFVIGRILFLKDKWVMN